MREEIQDMQDTARLQEETTPFGRVPFKVRKRARTAKEAIAEGAPIRTGDPVVDEWEREIAEGRLPAWMLEKDQ